MRNSHSKATGRPKKAIFVRFRYPGSITRCFLGAYFGLLVALAIWHTACTAICRGFASIGMPRADPSYIPTIQPMASSRAASSPY